jgi:hypothetical protein
MMQILSTMLARGLVARKAAAAAAGTTAAACAAAAVLVVVWPGATSVATAACGDTTAVGAYHAGAQASPDDPAEDFNATTYTYTPPPNCL